MSNVDGHFKRKGVMEPMILRDRLAAGYLPFDVLSLPSSAKLRRQARLTSWAILICPLKSETSPN
jgi:hypothetical protein